MGKLGCLVGLPVLEIETGIQIGQIAEILVNMEKVCVEYFVIIQQNLFQAEQVIAFEDLFRIGCDAVMVRNDHVVYELQVVPDDEIYYLRDLYQKQIFTESGILIGTLVDIAFDVITGELHHYQISDSIITDLLYGRKSMPLPQVQMTGEDKLIVPEKMIKLLYNECN